MTDDDIRERARAAELAAHLAACVHLDRRWGDYWNVHEAATMIEAAFRDVRKAERARCARIAETWGEVNTSRHASTLQMKEMFATLDKGAKTLADSIAAAIRRSE